MKKVFPEIVSAIDGRKFVSHQGLIPVLVAAIKEQQVLMSGYGRKFEGKVYYERGGDTPGRLNGQNHD
ncbi:MAG TPA: hypothetical protein DCQ94_15565 [Nitrospira sp.]|nr:hypothetical protein [Nitrospira sp.]